MAMSAGDASGHDQFKYIGPASKALFGSVPQTLDIEARLGVARLIQSLTCYQARSAGAKLVLAEGIDPSRMIFDLINCEKSELKFNAFGCQGADAGAVSAARKFFVGDADDQLAVADFMKGKLRIAPSSAGAEAGFVAADLNLVLGDNFYDDGVNSVGSEKFTKAFHNYYSGLSLVALGNHDWHAHSGHTTSGVMGALKTTKLKSKWGRPIECAYNQVFQTYNTIPFNQRSLSHPLGADNHINKDGNWQMPFRYYMVRHLFVNIFVIDSSTIAFDLEQQQWLVETIREQAALAPQRLNILMTHHPLLYHGKRRTKAGEWHQYKKIIDESLPGDHQPMIYVHGGGNLVITKGDVRFSNIGKILQHILSYNNLSQIDLVVAAHEHFLCSAELTLNFIDHATRIKTQKTIYQITSGGGGAAIGNIKHCDKPEDSVITEFGDALPDPHYEQAEGIDSETIALTKGSPDPRSNILVSAKTLYQQACLGFFELHVNTRRIYIQPRIAFQTSVPSDEQAQLIGYFQSAGKAYRIGKTVAQPVVAMDTATTTV